MPEAIAFDTHRFVKRLTDSGFTERQAETLADEHVALLNGNLATRVDVEKVRADVEKVRADVEKVRADVENVRADVENVRADVVQLSADVVQLRADVVKIEARVAKIEARIEEAKSEILKWVFGALIAQGGLIVALVKLL